MEWNIIYELIDSRLLIVVALCWVIGFIFKKTPVIPDWTIIYIVTVISIIFTIWMLGWSAESLIQGVLAGAFSVFGNQLVKQTRKGLDDK